MSALLVTAGGSSAVVAVAQSGGSGGRDLNDDPQYEAGERRAEERRKRLAGPESRRARRESRAKFRGLSKAEALSVAREEFATELRGRLPDGSNPAAGLKVRRRLGDQAAIVEDERTNERVLMRSTQPQVVEASDGDAVPFDLSLSDRGGAFVPEATEVPVRIADAQEARISLPEAGFSVGLDSSAGSDATATLSSDRVFYANTLADADAVVSPKNLGAELYVQMRSPESPERYVLDVDLSDGATLRRAMPKDPIADDTPETVEVVRDGETVGYVYPPNAYDADGIQIPSTMAIDGDKLVLDVRHRGREIRYPAMVDPEVIQWGRGSGNKDTDWPDWRWRQNLQGGTQGFGAARNDPAYYYGLYLSMPTNTGFYSGAYTQWYFKAPAYTYLYRSIFGDVSHNPFYCSGSSCSRATNAIANPSLTQYEPGVSYRNQHDQPGGNPGGPWPQAFTGFRHDFCYETRCNRGAGPEGNTAVMGLEAHNPAGGNIVGTGATGKATTTMGWADVYLGDRRAPSLQTRPGSTGWQDDGAVTHTLNASTNDLGLGMDWMSFFGSASGTGYRYAGCAYDNGFGVDNRTYACPLNQNASWSYTLNQGVNNLSLNGQDIVGNGTGTHSWQRRIDRSDPYAVDLSGELASREGRAIGSPATLRAIGRDTYSAVRRLELLVDGQSVDGSMPGTQVATQGDPGQGVDMDRDLYFDPTNLTEGPHDITVRATDGVNRSRTSRTLRVIVDRTPPAITSSTQEDRPTEWTDDAIASVSLSADDLAPGQPDYGSGVVGLRLLREGATIADRRPEPSCAGTVASRCPRTFADALPYDTSSRADFPEDGIRRLQVEAYDAIRPTQGESWEVKIDREAPELTLSGPLAERNGQAIAPGTYQLDMLARDGTAGANSTARSGAERVEISVDGELVDEIDSACADGSCSIQRSFEFDTSDYAGGEHEIEVTADDALGHSTTETLTVTTECCQRAIGTWGTSLPLDDVAYADVNGDLRADLLRFGPTGSVDVGLSRGDGFDGATRWGQVPADAEPVTGDFDGDGDADLGYTASEVLDDAPEIRVHLSDRERFGGVQRFGDWTAGYDLRTADLDGDELDDLVGHRSSDGAVQASYSNGQEFLEPETWATLAPDSEIHVADANGDDDADLISRPEEGTAVTVRISDGGAFVEPTAWTTLPSGDVELAIADLDGEGTADLAIRRSGNDRLLVAPSTGDGFSAQRDWGEAGGTTDEFALADLDDNSQADAVLRSTATGSVRAGLSATVPPIRPEPTLPFDDSLPYDDTDVPDVLGEPHRGRQVPRSVRRSDPGLRSRSSGGRTTRSSPSAADQAPLLLKIASTGRSCGSSKLAEASSGSSSIGASISGSPAMSRRSKRR